MADKTTNENERLYCYSQLKHKLDDCVVTINRLLKAYPTIMEHEKQEYLEMQDMLVGYHHKMMDEEISLGREIAERVAEEYEEDDESWD